MLTKEMKKWLEKTLNGFAEDNRTWQRRITNISNAFNGFVRMFEKIGIAQGWWKDRAEFQEKYAEAVAELVKEHREFEAAERARMKEEKQKGGNVIPMRRMPDPVDELSEVLPGNKVVWRVQLFAGLKLHGYLLWDDGTPREYDTGEEAEQAGMDWIEKWYANNADGVNACKAEKVVVPA